MTISRFHIASTALLVIDLQEKLLGHMYNSQQVLGQSGKLIDAFNVLELPMLMTEQYPKGLGKTVPSILQKVMDATPTFEKLAFSACGEPGVQEALSQKKIKSVILCGIETHVCVLQTALDLAEAGYTVGVAADAVGSRQELDCRFALERLQQAGVVVTTAESAILELVHQAGGDRFKRVLPLIKPIKVVTV